MRITQWQKDPAYLVAPSVWVTLDADGLLSSVYDSEEAAIQEVARYPNNRILQRRIHSLDMSLRRWAAPPSPSAVQPSQDVAGTSGESLAGLSKENEK